MWAILIVTNKRLLLIYHELNEKRMTMTVKNVNEEEEENLTRQQRNAWLSLKAFDFCFLYQHFSLQDKKKERNDPGATREKAIGCSLLLSFVCVCDRP